MRGGLNRNWVAAATVVAGALGISCATTERAGGPVGTASTQNAESRVRIPLSQVPRFEELNAGDLAGVPEGGASSGAAPSPAAALHLREGRSRYKQGLWADAITTLLRAIEADSTLTEARVLLGRAYRQLGDSGAARKHLVEARRLRPRDATINRLLAELALDGREPRKAIAYCLAALESDSEAPRPIEILIIRLELGAALRSEGYLLAAADQIERALDGRDLQSEDDRRLVESLRLKGNEVSQSDEQSDLIEAFRLFGGSATMGELEAQLGRFDRAVEHFRRALSADPSDGKVRRELVLALGSAGRGDEALAASKEYLERGGGVSEFLELLEEVCRRLGQPERYEAELSRVAANSTDANLRRKIADILLERGKSEESISLLEQLESEGQLDAEGSYRLAEIHLAAGDWHDLLASLTRALREAPDTHRRAAALLRRLKSAEDRRPLREMIRDSAGMVPVSAEADFVLGLLLEGDGQAEEAIGILRGVIERDPEFPGGHAALARVLGSGGDWEGVIEAAKAASDAGVSDSELSLFEGRAFAGLDDYEHAREAFLASFRLDRSSALPLFELAEESDRLGQVRECEQLYRRILDDVDPRYVPAREKLIRLYLNSNQLNRAEAYFSDFARLGQTGAVVERCQALLSFAMATGRRPSRGAGPGRKSAEEGGQSRMSEYQAALAEIVEKYPDDAGSRIDLAMTQLALGEFDQALRSADDALRLEPGNVRAMELKATVLQKLLRFSDSAGMVEGLLKQRPRNGPYRQRRIELALAEGDYDRAVGILRELLEREDSVGKSGGENQGMLIAGELVRVLVEAGRFDEAVAEARKRLERPRSRAIWQSIYLAILRSAGRAEEAVEVAEEWLESAPGDGDLRIQFVEQLENAGRFIEGRQRILEWLADEPDDWNLNRELIRLSWHTREYESAIEMARNGLESDPTSEPYREFLIQSLVLAGEFDGAVDLARKHAKNAEDLSAHVGLIHTLTEAGRFLEAEEAANRLMSPHVAFQKSGQAFNPDLVMAMRRLLSRIYELSGRSRQAVEQLEENLRFDPSDAGTQNDLGYLMANAGIDLPRAERMVRAAVAAEPRSFAFLDSLGWVLYKKGAFEEARRWLRRSADLSRPGDPVIFDHLGDTYYRLGQGEEAEGAWKKASELCQSRGALSRNIEETRLAEALSAKLRAIQGGGAVSVSGVVDSGDGAPASAPAQKKARGSQREDPTKSNRGQDDKEKSG